MGTLLFMDAHTSIMPFLKSTLLSTTTCVLYFPDVDTAETLLQKIPPGTYTHVGILQDNTFTDTYHFLDSFGEPILADVATLDPSLNSWVNMKEFFQTLKTMGMTHLDYIECNLGSNDWDYIITKLTQDLGIVISYSHKLIGEGGTWTLESDPTITSDDVALVGLYFTPNVYYYPYSLGTSGGTVETNNFTGEMHVIDTSNNLYSWGKNWFGSFGIGNTLVNEQIWNYTLTPSFSSAKIISVDGGVMFTMVVLDNGTVFGAGVNVYGNAGTLNGYAWGANQAAWNNFVQVPDITNAVDITCGDNHSLILLNNGDVMACGYNHFGQLAVNSTVEDSVLYNSFSKALVKCILPEPIKNVYANVNSSFFLAFTGNLYVSGDNWYGALGLNSGIINYGAVKITQSLFKAVAPGYYFTLALDLNGNIWGTGKNEAYQLGTGSTFAYTPTFQQITTSTVYKSISSGYLHAAAIDTNSRVWLWGNNQYGPLGNGTMANVTVPTMSAMTNVYSIVKTGYRFTILGILNNGVIQMYTSGLNTASRLRDPYDDAYQQWSFYPINPGLHILPTPTIQYVLPPRLFSVSPTYGTTNTPVIVTGTNLNTFTNASFGTTAATRVDINSSSSIVFYTPAGIGNVSLSMNNASGVVLTMPGNFTYQNPSITSIYPLVGTTNTILQISGFNLTNTSFVKLQGYNTSFTINSSVLLTASVNASSGNASIAVVDNLGNNLRYSENFTYQNPSVESIFPTFGMKNTILNISGFNLGNTSVVKMGTYNTSFSIVSPTSIQVTTPNTSGNVSVVLTDSVGNTNYAGNFTYKNVNISSVTPLYGSRNTPVKITGTTLTNTSFVVFGSTNASIQSSTATEVNVLTPANPNGNVSVYILDNDGNTIYNTSNFEYQNPAISMISPYSGTKNTIVVLSGSNLYNTSSVKIGGISSNFVIQSNQVLSAVAPNLPNGLVTVVATDTFGNQSSYPGFFVYKNPAVSSMTSSGTPNTTMVISGNNLEQISSVHFNDISAHFVPFPTYLNVSVPYGNGNASVSLIDGAGNNIQIPGNFLYKTPTITEMVPETAHSTTNLTLHGTYLENTSFVSFGNSSTKKFTATYDTINVSIPANKGNVSVTATDIYGNAATANNSFIYLDSFISEINPSVSPPKTTVNLSGGLLMNTSMIYFGETPTLFTIESDTSINVSVPTSSGNTSISLLDIYGYTTYYPGNFTYRTMAIDTIYPFTGIKNSTLVIKGRDLLLANTVSVGSSNASFQVISNYQLQLKVPTPSGDGKITITDIYGNNLVSKHTFVTKVPTVTSVDKTSGHIGDTLTVYGTDLSYMNYVVFGSEHAHEMLTLTDNQISCVIPYGIGTVSIQLLDNYMNSITISSEFTYISEIPIQNLVLLNRPTFTTFDTSNNVYSSIGTTVTKNNVVIYTSTFPLSGVAVDQNRLYACDYSNYRIVKYDMNIERKTFLPILLTDHVQPNMLKIYDRHLYVLCTAVPSTTNPDYLYIFTFSKDSFNYTYERKALLPAYTYQGVVKGQTMRSGVSEDCLYLSAITRNSPTQGRICITDVSGNLIDEEFITGISNPIDLLYLNEHLYIDGNTVILVNVNSPSTALATYQSSPNSQYNSLYYGTNDAGANVIYMINATTNTVETIPAPSVMSSSILANSISPTFGPQYTRVVITGQNFLASDYTPQVTGVQFQSVPALHFTIISSSTIYCDVPIGSGSANIHLVDASNQLISTSLVYNYQTPVIQDNYPKRLMVGDSMFIYGLNMNLVKSILIGTVSATFVLLRLDYIQVKIPNGTGVDLPITLIDTLNNVISDPAYTFSYYTANSNTCFPSGTLVKSDQGQVEIQNLIAGHHTLQGKKIVAITETYSVDPDLVFIEKDALRKNYPSVQTFISPRHKIYYKGKMKAAFRLIGHPGVSFVPYGGQKLYNVLLEQNGTMNVHGMICESLDPSNPLAKHYLRQIKREHEILSKIKLRSI